MSWVLLANELATKNDVVAAKAGLFRLWGVGGLLRVTAKNKAAADAVAVSDPPFMEFMEI